MTCQNGYLLYNGQCLQLQLCPPGTYQGYQVTGLLRNGQSRSVSRTVNGTPANGYTRYSATAYCDSGNITIGSESSRIICNSGYTQSGNSCVPNAPVTPIGTTRACSIANGTGQQTWNGSSWSACQVVSCNAGYQQSGNACTPNVQYCAAGSVQGRWATYYVGQIAHGGWILAE